MADRTIELVSKVFPQMVRENEKGKTEVSMLSLVGANYEWIEYESNHRERVYFGLTAAGKHLSNQDYDNVFCEYRFDKETDKSGSHNAVDAVITAPNGKVIAMIENGMFEATTAMTKENLDEHLYRKLAQVVSVVLRSKFALDKMYHTVKFNVNIYHTELALETSKQHHQYVNLDKTIDYFERFKRTGIASVTFTLSLDELKLLAANYPNGMVTDDARDYGKFDLNTRYSNIALLYLNGGSATGHTSVEPNSQGFKYIFNQSRVNPLVLNRILPRSINAGGSYADNPRAKNNERIKSDRAPFIKSMVEYLKRIDFDYDPQSGTSLTVEASTITSGDRVVQASSESTMVIFNDIIKTVDGVDTMIEKEVIILSSDITLNDAQHSNDTILMNKRAMIAANGSVEKILEYLEDLDIHGAKNLKPNELKTLSDFILKLTPSVVFEAFINLDTMTQAGDIKQNVAEQGLRAKARFAKKAQLKTLAASVSNDERLSNYEIVTGAPFSDAKEHTLDSGLETKEIAEINDIVTPFLDMQDFGSILKSKPFKNDVDLLNERAASGEIDLQGADAGKIMVAVHLIRKGKSTFQAEKDLANFYKTFTTSPIADRTKENALTALHDMNNPDLNSKEQFKILDAWYKTVKKDYQNTFSKIYEQFVESFIDLDTPVPGKLIDKKAQMISDLKVTVDTARLVPLTLMHIATTEKIANIKIKDSSSLPISAAAAIIGYFDYLNEENTLTKSKDEIFEAVDTALAKISGKTEEKMWVTYQAGTLENGQIKRLMSYFSEVIDFTTPTIIKAELPELEEVEA